VRHTISHTGLNVGCNQRARRFGRVCEHRTDRPWTLQVNPVKSGLRVCLTIVKAATGSAALAVYYYVVDRGRSQQSALESIV
jgi:hypothetical protein